MTSLSQDLGSVEDFFASGGGKALKFNQVGDTYAGVIQSLKVTQQTKFPSGDPDFNKDGTPKKQIVATLSTSLRDPSEPDDDGTRNLYIKGNLQFAVSKALKKHGLKAPQVGGTIVVKFSGQEDTGKGNPLKLFEAAYKPAEPEGLEAALTQGQPVAQPAPVAQPVATQPVAQPVAQPNSLSATEAALLEQLNAATA